MKHNRFVIPIIILLLLCSLPLSIYGIYNHILMSKEAGNPDHLHKLDGKLYYYNKSDQLIGYYECENDTCTDGKSIIDDMTLEYKKGTKENFDIYNNKYVFISDNGNIVLYDLKAKAKIITFKTVNNYNFDVNRFIGKTVENKYILFTLGDMMMPLLNEGYDYIGNADMSTLKNYLVSKNGEYYIVNEEKKELSAHFTSDVKFYNDNLIITYENNEYYFYNYQKELLIDNSFSKLDILDKTFVGKSGPSVIYLDSNLNELSRYYADDYNISNNTLNIIRNGNVIDSINFNEVVNEE